jgi:hypothetical protein
MDKYELHKLKRGYFETLLVQNVAEMARERSEKKRRRAAGTAA